MVALNLFKSLLFILFLSAGFVSCTHEGKEDSHSEHAEVQKYHCPMHPQIIDDQPGSCPICGMDLVPIENEPEHSAHSDRSSVQLNAQKQQLIGVKTEVLKLREMTKSIQAPGRIAFDPDLYSAKSEYLEALRQWSRVKDSPLEEVRESTQGMIRSARIRLRVLGLSDDQIKKLSRSGRADESLILGDKGGRALIYADVFESDLPYVEAGLSAWVSSSSFGGERRKAKVIAVDSVIDSKARTARVRLELESSKELLRPDSYVSVEIMSPLGKHLAIPREAVLNTGKEELVFVKTGEGQFEPKILFPKLRGDRYVAIGSELAEGSEVVTEANFMMDSEARLKAVAGSHKH